jgi:HSP20 family molecular chaperone IbpA
MLEERIAHTIEQAVKFNIEKQAEKLPHYYPSTFIDNGMNYELAQFVGAMKPEELTLSEKNGMLTIEGKSSSEFPNGSCCDYQFKQRVPIPKESMMNKMTSFLKNGHIVVVLPKK